MLVTGHWEALVTCVDWRDVEILLGASAAWSALWSVLLDTMQSRITTYLGTTLWLLLSTVTHTNRNHEMNGLPFIYIESIKKGCCLWRL